MHALYKKSASLIKEAKAILVSAGAGMGVDSGLPDFRGPSGFWKAYPPYKQKGLSFIDMANPDWFYSDPLFAWGFYGHRLNLYRKTIPHRGFDLLLKWASSKPLGYFVFTSNVDGQFQKASFINDNILEVHGSIHYLQCLKQCKLGIYNADSSEISIDTATMTASEPLPSCPLCKSLARPNILMFGDYDWDSKRQSLQNVLYQKWLSSIAGEKLVIIECGAGKAVPTVRIESEQVASVLSASVIRINLYDSQIQHPHIPLGESVLTALEKIDALIC